MLKAVTTRYTVQPFQPTHLLVVCPQAQEMAHGLQAMNVASLPAEQVTALTLCRHEEPWAIGGVLSPWPTLGLVFLYCRPAPTPAEAVIIGRHLLRGWQRLKAQTACWRYETMVLASFVPARVLLEKLGFGMQTVKSRYGPQGETFLEYAYVCTDRERVTMQVVRAQHG